MVEKRIIINNLETPFWIEDTGRLRNENTKHWLKGSINKGYHFYNLYFKGKQHTLYTHRLVAQYFIPNPNNLKYVHHKDGNKLNNNIYNLEWVSSQEHGEIHQDDMIKRDRKMISINHSEIDINELKQFRESPYYVSKDGQVFNLSKNIVLKQEKSGDYLRVQCNYNLNGKHFLVHRMVWECFNGEIPEGFEINHIDSNPRNNNLGNLELVTHTNNCIKARHNSKAVYSKNIDTGEITEYSSLNRAARKIFNSRSISKIQTAIKNGTLINNCYWYYKE